MKRFAWSSAIPCLVCLGCLAALLVAAVPARADVPLSSTPDPQVWVTNGTVRAMATAADGTTYIGGSFLYVGPATGSGVALNATSGARDTSFPFVDGRVDAAVPDGAGGFYISGTFTVVGGFARNNIAHILAGGSVDAAFDPSANNSVMALAVSGTTVYAGGGFTVIGGQSRNGIAALDATTGAATAWNPNAGGTSPYVWALAVSGSTVYAGGDFTSIGGQGRNYIAALDASSGLATAWNPNAGGTDPLYRVHTLAVSGSTVYAGGRFFNIGGQNRHHIAALDASSGLATAWDPSAWNPDAYPDVYALAVSGSTVYVGGDFTEIGGQTRNRIAAVDASTGLATAWDPDASSGVRVLAVSGSAVYVGGGFEYIGGQYWSCLARFSSPDATAPVTSNDAPAAWQQGAVTVHLTPIDSGSGIVGGLAKTEYSRDGGLTWQRGTTVTYDTWKRGGGSGLHTLLYRSTDAAGNLEEERSCEVKIDARPPRTTDDAPLTPQTGNVTVHLTAADSLTGVTASSGVKETWYSVDGAGWVKGSAVTITAAGHIGRHWIAYYSTDNAGNTEMTRWCSLTISASALVRHAVRGLARR